LESPQTKVRLRQQLERRGEEATEAVAASVGTGTYSSVIPEPRLRSSALHQFRSHVLVSRDFFLLISSLFEYHIPFHICDLQ
jgi:hypothetical protein